jgi:hypothetical protein
MNLLQRTSPVQTIPWSSNSSIQSPDYMFSLCQGTGPVNMTPLTRQSTPESHFPFSIIQHCPSCITVASLVWMWLWDCAIAAHERLDMVALWRLSAAVVVRFGVLGRSRSCVGDEERAFSGCTWSLIPTAHLDLREIWRLKFIPQQPILMASSVACHFSHTSSGDGI